MNKKALDIKFWILLVALSLVGAWRVYASSIEWNGWTNFSPIGAMALFAGYYFTSRPKAYLTPMLVLLISDVILMNTLFIEYRSGFLYSGWYWTYGSFILMVALGEFFKAQKAYVPALLGSIIAGCIHFFISNFGVWLGSTMYTQDLSGLMACYTAAIPFFKHTLLGNLLFSGLLFGGFILLEARVPALRRATQP